MPDITLVRQQPLELTEEERAVLSKALFGIIDGLGEVNRRRWRGFWRRMLKLEPGEMVEVKTLQARLGPYHRRHMAFEQLLFESQERFDNFKGFRDWMKVGAGHCDWYPMGNKGGIFPVPKTIGYDQMEQGEMEEFHDNAVTFLKSDRAVLTLWKHLPALRGLEIVEQCLARWGWE